MKHNVSFLVRVLRHFLSFRGHSGARAPRNDDERSVQLNRDSRSWRPSSPSCSRPRRGAGLSEPAHHPDRSLLGRRRQRPHGANRRRENTRRWASRSYRKSWRRGRQHRHPPDRQERARRLHAGARRHRHARHQSDTLRQCRQRPAQGFRPGRPHRHQRPRRLRAPSLPVRSIPDLIALAKEEPGHADLRFGRDRQRHPSRQRRSRRLRRHQADHVPYKAVRRADRSDRRPCRDLFSSLPPTVALVKEGKVRALALTGANADRSSRTCRRSRKPRCPATRRSCATGSSRQRARRARSWISSARRCAPP